MNDQSLEITQVQIEFLLKNLRDMFKEVDINTFFLMSHVGQAEEMFNFIFKKARETNDSELKVNLIKMFAFQGFVSVMNTINEVFGMVMTEVMKNDFTDIESVFKELKERLYKI
jgi:hypothetical protein